MRNMEEQMGLERILVTRDLLCPLLVLAVIHVSMISAEKKGNSED